jgi:glycosyltransferase involved in cell wall biosynthesis
LLESAFASVSQTHPGVELHLYGPEGADSPGIRRFGKYDESDLDRIIATADFGILPSIWPEAYGYVGPEMLSRGLPVLASNIGAMPDYVTDGENGLLFDPAAPDGLEAAIRRLITEPGLSMRLWQQAATGERRYLTMSEHIDRLTEIYTEVVNERAEVSKTTAL